MRRLAVAMAMGGLLAAPAAADPGHGPVRVEIGGGAFTPADLRISQGDLVIWEWRGPDTNHSVTADDVRRAAGGPVLRKTTFGVPPGAGKRVLKLGGLAAGRHALTVTALDATTGKPANSVRRAFTLK